MKKVLVTLVVLLVLAAAGGAAYWSLRQARLTAFAQEPFGSREPKIVEIAHGTAPKSLATLLASHGVIANADEFYAYVRREKIAPKLKAGEYEFTGPLTPVQVIDKLVSGQVKVYRFTIPEGLRVEEILPILASSELKLDLAKLTQLSENTKFIRKTGVPEPAVTFEGFLFPDTYIFTRGFTEEAVLQKMVTRTFEEYKKAEPSRKAGNKLDLFEIITLASIIEKETGAPDERGHIGCVFHNRLRLKIKLMTDPTVLYAKRLWSGVFTKNITKKDLLTEHPYNTYTIFGLPPGPIASPGAAAIEAALNPPDCRDLYFVSRNNGTSEFCPDLKCHNAAVLKYQINPFKKHGSPGN